MTKDEVKQFIVETVNGSGGIKGLELVSRFIPLISQYKTTYFAESVISILDELVKDRAILEVEYILPDNPQRIKSFFLPAGSHVFFTQQTDLEKDVKIEIGKIEESFKIISDTEAQGGSLLDEQTEAEENSQTHEEASEDH